MKDFIIRKCMSYVKKNTNYDKQKLIEIKYGLSTLYLVISKFLIISILCIFLGIFKEMLIFTTIFTILRMPAFGLHATKSWICLISSAIIFISLTFLCINIKLNLFIRIIISLVSIIFILKNAPADTRKKPIVNKSTRKKYKIISTILAVIFSVGAIYINNLFISNCLVFSLILENLLISPIVYKIFNQPYNNYITYLKNHPELTQ